MVLMQFLEPVFWREIMKDNIVLIGMPGVGKSTAGVILAKILGYQFIDADLVIQKSQGKKLKEIIEEKGVDGFIEIENAVCKSLCPEKTIIATGGSAVYGKEAMEHFREIANIVYLKLEYPYLARRLGNLKQRGVVLRKGQNLKDLYLERAPLYEKYADVVVDEHRCTIEQTVEKMIEALEKLD